MAIPGDFLWDVSKYAFDTSTGATGLPTQKAKDRRAEFAAKRWFGLFKIDSPSAWEIAYSAFAALSSTDLEKLMKPGYYPDVSGNAASGFTVTVMADGKFPNFVNHRGFFRSPAGQLGLPEQNEFGGGNAGAVIPITDPAI